MKRVFIIGDIHGCCKTFKKMIFEKINIRSTDEIYCLGDYVDRGPDSKGVIDFILDLRNKGYQIHTLRGNHEQMLLESDIDEFTRDLWMRNGGNHTLRSFRKKSVSAFEAKYLEFFEQTSYFVQTNDFILVHAGLNFNAPNPLLDFEAMMWIRDFWTDKDFLNGRILIHGHTPLKRDALLAQPFENIIDIDGGCVFKERTGYGSLFALNFFEKHFLEMRNID